jgi:DTW domain-containing protein YfiP
MGRSVVLAGAARCPRCSLPPRWCICDAIPSVDTHLRVHVLIHHHEHHKPSSTGKLIARVVAGTNCHIYQRESRLSPASGLPSETLVQGSELWILHPNGEPLPAAAAASAADPRSPHMLLLDGTWRQAGEMLHAVEGMGRCVCLPEPTAEPSRYWLRDQREPTHLSTAEALMGVFKAMGDSAAELRLKLHFELHVYATLLARGRREMAERYLGHSPLLSETPEVLDRLHTRQTGRTLTKGQASL